MRAMLTPGASNTCSARLLASVAITSPNTLATLGSNDAATAVAEGRAVAFADEGWVNAPNPDVWDGSTQSF